MGARVKICAVDWNNDGRLDLLLGDRSGEMVELSTEKKSQLDQQVAKLKNRMAESNGKLKALKAAVADDPDDEDLTEKLAELKIEVRKENEDCRKSIAEVSKQSKPQRVKHGFVHLFLRKPIEKLASAKEE